MHLPGHATKRYLMRLTGDLTPRPASVSLDDIPSFSCHGIDNRKKHHVVGCCVTSPYAVGCGTRAR